MGFKDLVFEAIRGCSFAFEPSCFGYGYCSFSRYRPRKCFFGLFMLLRVVVVVETVVTAAAAASAVALVLALALLLLLYVLVSGLRSCSDY